MNEIGLAWVELEGNDRKVLCTFPPSESIVKGAKVIIEPIDETWYQHFATVAECCVVNDSDTYDMVTYDHKVKRHITGTVTIKKFSE